MSGTGKQSSAGSGEPSCGGSRGGRPCCRLAQHACQLPNTLLPAPQQAPISPPPTPRLPLARTLAAACARPLAQLIPSDEPKGKEEGAQ